VGSKTYGVWEGFHLKSDEIKLLYIPGDCAHGYETLTDNCMVQYMVSEFYSPEYEKGFRWDDPTFNIKWPMKPTFMSEKDKNLPNYEGKAFFPEGKQI
jgi:dTDP-4-dehydrorhamnose 3,5-epimerase